MSGKPGNQCSVKLEKQAKASYLVRGRGGR